MRPPGATTARWLTRRSIGSAAPRATTIARSPAAAPILARAGSAPSDLVAAQALAIGWAGIAAALPVPLQRLTGACAPAALVDTNRRQLCDAAAATLGERSDSAQIASVGAAIGRRVGWPLDRARRDSRRDAGAGGALVVRPAVSIQGAPHRSAVTACAP